MAKALMKILVIITLSLFPMKSFGAKAVKFRHMISVYSDEMGGGFKQPEGVACNDRSFFMVADTGNNRLLPYTFQEGNLNVGAEIKVPQLMTPVHVQTNSKGEIFALDGRQQRIVRLSPEGEFKGYLEPSDLPSPASYFLKSFKIDRNDNIYFLDVFSGRVVVLNPEGEYQKHIEFPENYGFISDLSVDSQGSVFLIDSTDATVFFSAKDSASFSPLTKGLKEYVEFPTSLTVDDRGRIYIVDRHGGNIVILGPDGSYQGRLLSMGWKEGQLHYPSQLCINDKGEVFIADSNNNRIQIFNVVK